MKRYRPGTLSAEQGGGDVFGHACAMGLEGIVSKRAASRYRSGSCKSWLKVKNPDYGEAAVRKRGGGRALSCGKGRMRVACRAGFSGAPIKNSLTTASASCRDESVPSPCRP
jgi:ATP-dependent DNA ligase